MPFLTSYLQLALARARNLRVKKEAGKGRQEHHTMTFEDFHLHWMKKHGIRRIHKEPDKNAPVRTALKAWKLFSKMFASGDEGCPVVAFKKFL